MSTPAAIQTRPKITEPLRVREFRLLLTGFIVGQSMMPLQFVASIAWVQSFADDSVQLILVGAIGTIRGLGMLGFGLFGGALADRFDRRNLLIVTQAVALATNLGIAAVMWLGMTDTTGLIVFFMLTLLASAAFALDSPTRQAIAPEILGPRLTPAGIALQQAGMQFGMPVAILLSGVMIDRLGAGNVFAISAAGHLAEIVVLAMMSYRTVFSAEHMRGVETGPKQALRDIVAGLRFSRSNPVILWTILIVVLMMALIMPPTGTLGPTWVTTVVGASDIGFSIIAFFWGFGAMLTSIIVAAFSWYERKGILTASGALTDGRWDSWCSRVQPSAAQRNGMGNFLLGAGMSMAMIAVVAIIAHETPNDMRGRVMSMLHPWAWGSSQAAGSAARRAWLRSSDDGSAVPSKGRWGTFALHRSLVIVFRPGHSFARASTGRCAHGATDTVVRPLASSPESPASPRRIKARSPDRALHASPRTTAVRV